MHFERIVDRDGNPPAHVNQRLFDKHTGRMVQDGLIQQVGMMQWTTPQAHDAQGTPTASRHGRYGTKHGGRNLPDHIAAAEQWQTPSTQPERRNSYPNAPDVKRPCLDDQAKGLLTVESVNNWNTPSAQDAKNATLPPSLRGRDSVVGQCLQAHTSIRGKPRGSLNPAWVGQLMGYPDGWLDISAETASKLSATRSARKSSKSSPAA